jgi:hypothetical protein
MDVALFRFRQGKNSSGRRCSFSELEIAKARSVTTVLFGIGNSQGTFSSYGTFRTWYFDYILTPDVPFRPIEEVSTLEENTTPCKPCRTTEATNPISSSNTLLSSARDLTLCSVPTHWLTARLTPLRSKGNSFYVSGQARSHIRSIWNTSCHIGCLCKVTVYELQTWCKRPVYI